MNNKVNLDSFTALAYCLMDSYSRIIDDSILIGHCPLKWNTQKRFLELELVLNVPNLLWLLKYVIIGFFGGFVPCFFVINTGGF